MFFSKKYLLPLFFLLINCASHPTIADRTLEKGEEYYGYTISTENIFPVLFYRYGLSDVSDIGLRLGIPVYGSGFDYSRTLYEKGKKRDVLNIGWSLNPNSNLDFTYYKFLDGKKEGSSLYWALRGMLIPEGSYKESGSSSRIGILVGIFRKGKIGIEGGYFHDFASMPISKLYIPSWDKFIAKDENKEKFGRFDLPHVSPAGWPTQHSRLVGLSLRLTFSLNSNSLVDEKKNDLNE